jgi:hypothetical protein
MVLHQANVFFVFVYWNVIIYKCKTMAILLLNLASCSIVQRKTWNRFNTMFFFCFYIFSALTRSSYKSLMSTFLFPAVIVSILTSQHRQTNYDMAANAVVVELTRREQWFLVQYECALFSWCRCFLLFITENVLFTFVDVLQMMLDLNRLHRHHGE